MITRFIKIIVFLVMPLFSFVSNISAQTSVTVDVGKRLKILNGRESGINMDYLMDGSYLTPATSTTTALKNMGVKLMRYPGGEKSDNYLWSAAPWTASSPRMALLDAVNCWPTGDALFVDQANAEKKCKSVVLDFDEFMTMSKAVGAQPLIVVAYDAMYNSVAASKPTKAQLIEHAKQWVRYANITKKYGIKYWMIGNESWNLPDYNGRTTAAQYAADIVAFASAMKAVDPTIKIIANGQSSWWPTLLKSSAVSYIDILGFSLYPVYGYTAGYETYRRNNKSLTGEADAAIKAIATYAPSAHRARLKVLATEYNSMDWAGNWGNENNLGHALCNFQIFGDMVINPKVESICLWNTRWVDNQITNQHIYDALDKAGNINATGTAQRVWGRNLLNTMITAASSDTMLKAYATYDTVTKNTNIFLLNKDIAAKKVKVSLKNYTATYRVVKYVFSGSSVSDMFPKFLKQGDTLLPPSIASLTIAPASVTLLKLLPSAALSSLTVQSFAGHASEDSIRLEWQASADTGLTHYAIEKSASFSNPFHFNATIVSNPVRHQLQVRFFSGAGQMVTVQITDAAGRIWGSEKVWIEAGTTTRMPGNISLLQSGQYWLRISTSTQHKTIPFQKL
jgi:alpha-N-arabinofuranosidase